jgi:hypothetical protein
MSAGIEDAEQFAHLGSDHIVVTSNVGAFVVYIPRWRT